MKAFARLALAAAAALSAGCAGLFRGDRVTVERDYIHLDDPVFLQSSGVHGHRVPGAFSFRLPVYFNARPGDTLRLGAQALRVRPARGADTAAPAAIACLADTASALPDSAALAARLADTARVLSLAARSGPDARVELGIHCAGYDPPWGRTDTLELTLSRPAGPAAMSLPFHVSYRGPVVSVLLGTGLLLAFTQAGWWIASER